MYEDSHVVFDFSHYFFFRWHHFRLGWHEYGLRIGMVPIQCRKIIETFLLFLVHWCDNWMYSDSASHQLYTKEIYNGMYKILGNNINL